VQGGVNVTITGITFTGQGTDRFGVVITEGSFATITNCSFGNFPGGGSEAISAFDGSTIHLRDVRITGNIAFPLVCC
jgi:hypothetical protein